MPDKDNNFGRSLVSCRSVSILRDSTQEYKFVAFAQCKNVISHENFPIAEINWTSKALVRFGLRLS